MLFSLYLSIRTIRNNFISAGKASGISLEFNFKDILTQALCHDLEVILIFLFLPENITLVHYIDDLMLIEPSDQEVVTTLDLLVTHMRIRGLEKSNQNLRAFCLTESLWSPVVWGIQKYSL